MCSYMYISIYVYIHIYFQICGKHTLCHNYNYTTLYMTSFTFECQSGNDCAPIKLCLQQ